MTGQLPDNVPVMVHAAHVAAERLGFTRSTIDEVGQLLELLVSQFPDEVIGEIGGGCGVGSAWMASGLQKGSRLVTIDNDPELVESVRSRFGDHSQVEILLGDWRLILDRGPFAMLFVDVAEAKEEQVDAVIDALRPGGLAVIDDLTPHDHWPQEQHGVPDVVRDRWLHHPRLRAVELLVTPTSAVILATRRR